MRSNDKPDVGRALPRRRWPRRRASTEARAAAAAGGARIRGSAALLALAAAACSSDLLGPEGGDAMAIELAVTAVMLDRLEEDVVFEARVVDGRGRPVRDVRLEWSVADPTVLEHREADRFRTVGNGTTTVRVVVAGAPHVSADATVTVEQRAVAVAIVPGTALLEAIGAERELTAAAVDGNGVALAGVPIEWRTSDPGVVAVDAAGRARARADGTALIEAVAAEVGLTGTAQLTVRASFRSVACVVSTIPAVADAAARCATTTVTVRAR